MKKHACKGCKDRFIGCHSICPTYIAIESERQEQLQKSYKTRHLNNLVKGFQLASVESWERRIR